MKKNLAGEQRGSDGSKPPAEQIGFFDDPTENLRADRRERAVDDIRKKFGKGAIQSGGVLASDIGIDKER